MDGWLRIGTKMDNKDFDKQIKELQSKLKTLTDTLESESKIPVELRMDKNARIKLESDIEKVKNRIISLKKEAGDIEPGATVEKSKKGFDGLYKSAKKLAFGILSIRTAYTILSRASSAYMATDTVTTNQLEANWVGLGTILEPVIKFIIDLMKKAVTSVLHFMSVLTGVDYIAKANANALKKQSQATKDLTKANDKLSASFDEMEVLKTNDSNTVSSGIDTNALFDINDISESTRKAIKKIGTALKPVYDIVKKIIDWTLKNPEAIVGILGGMALLSFLGKVIGTAGAGTATGTGLAGIMGVLLAIAGIGVITISIYMIYKSVQEAQRATKNADDAVRAYKKSSEELTKVIENLIDVQEISNEQVKVANERFKNSTESSLNLAESYKEQLNNLDPFEALLHTITGEYKGLAESTKIYIDDAYEQIKAWQKLYDQGLLNEEQTEDYKNALSRFKDMVGDSSENIVKLSSNFNMNEEDAKNLMNQYKDVSEQLDTVSSSSITSKDKIKELSSQIKNLPDEKVIKIDADTSKAKSGIGSFFSNLASKVSSFFGINMSVPKLATGGIINNPGRGVPLGSAVGGEAGKEGVIPLTDSQAMEELGSAIGRYITVNLTNNTNLDGRTIARHQSKVQANNDFAMNR